MPSDHPFKLLLHKTRTPSEGWRWLVYRDRNLVAISVFERVYASADEAKAGLDHLETTLLQLKQRHGWPHSDSLGDSNLSAFSGPQPDLPIDQVRADPNAGGRPYMPADNPAYLGRSLFTDFLLPVELGGFLLLAATIGAIAIAQRRTTPEAP